MSNVSKTVDGIPKKAGMRYPKYQSHGAVRWQIQPNYKSISKRPARRAGSFNSECRSAVGIVECEVWKVHSLGIGNVSTDVVPRLAQRPVVDAGTRLQQGSVRQHVITTIRIAYGSRTAIVGRTVVDYLQSAVVGLRTRRSDTRRRIDRVWRIRKSAAWEHWIIIPIHSYHLRRGSNGIGGRHGMGTGWFGMNMGNGGMNLGHPHTLKKFG
jgi:hypothetical protein